jgi:ABC-type multidrug transport system fused ATPase/permease subunit
MDLPKPESDSRHDSTPVSMSVPGAASGSSAVAAHRRGKLDFEIFILRWFVGRRPRHRFGRGGSAMDSFWDYVWYTVVVFAFVAYLIVLFQIIVDLFRDHSVSGWVKAIWVIGLVVLPYLTALVYLIARGRGMAVRAQRAQAEAKQATDEYIRTVAVGKSPAEQIADAKALLDSGAITPTEYEHLKAQALGNVTTGRDGVPIA